MKTSNFITCKKELYAYVGGIVLVVLMISLMIFSAKVTKVQDAKELLVSQKYEQVKEGDNNTQSENVKFDAYVLKDLNGDGNAEKLRGTCKKIGEQDNLYMELSVNSGGTLKEGKIAINGKNFYLATALVSDDVINGNYISKDTKSISLNQIEEGTNTLIQGIIKSGDYSYESSKASAIQEGNINNYSISDNEIVFTGVYVDSNGEEIQIRKIVNLTVDWYGEIEAALKSTYQKYQLNYNNSILDFSINLEETKKELIISKVYVEGTIPQLNGYDPMNVTVQDGIYNSETRTFTIEKSSQVLEDGVITTQIPKESEFIIKLQYPQAAFENFSSEEPLIITIPVKAYYEGYNNANVYETIVTQSDMVERDYTISYFEYIPNAQYAYNTYINTSLNKRNVINAYHDKDNIKNDRYEAVWQILRSENTESGNIIVKQERLDSIDNLYTDSIKNKGIYFTGNITSLIGNDGYIKLYNDETNELIKQFSINELNDIYTYESDVKYIRIETSDVISSENDDLGSITIHNIKEIDSLELSNSMNIDELLKYERIYNFSKLITDNELGGVASTAYYSPTSDITLNIDKQEVSTQEASSIKLEIEANNQLEDSWKNGSFLVKFPQKITNVNINSIGTNNSNVSIAKYEKYEENGYIYIKIETTNKTPINYKLNLNLDIQCDPMSMTSTENIEAYASNPNNEIYDLENRVLDEYDLNENGNKNEYVAYKTKSLNIIAPNSLLTTEHLIDNDGNILAKPSGYLEIDKDKLSQKHTVEVKVLNNYSGEGIKDTVIVGKIPSKDNTYVLDGKNIGSIFSTNMTSEGIKIPSELKDKVKIYYSEKDNVTKDIADQNNEWTENPSDFAKVKSYLIDLSSITLGLGQSYSFYYDFTLPSNVGYNEISYSTHAVYFELQTNEGRLKQEIQTNKLGILVAKRVNLELTKYEELSDELVSGSTYSITDGNSQELNTTDVNGKITFNNLFVEEEYYLKEEKENPDYEKDSQIIRFTTYVENEELKIKILEGTTRNNSIVTENNKTWAKIDLDSKVKYTLNLNKYEFGTDNMLSNVKFDLIGDDESISIQTDSKGNVTVARLLQDKVYTLRETYAKGFEELTEDINFKVVREGNQFKYYLISGDVKSDSNLVKEVGSIPVLTLNVENKKMESCVLELTKLETNKEVSIPNTVFNIKGKWLGEDGINYTTNTNGIIRIDLYDGIEYTLKEIKAADGYVLNNQEIKFVATKNIDGSWNFTTTQGNFKSDAVIEDNKIKVELENDSLFTITKQDQDTGKLLKGVKFAIYEVTKQDDGTETLSDAKDINDNIVGTKETIDGVEYQILETDENGSISEQLKSGLYKAIEVQALEGYDISNRELYTYYFGIGESSQGKTNITLEWENENIKEFDISKTSDGGYVGVHDKVITKYDSNFNVIWKTDSSGNYWSDFKQVEQTNDGGYIVLSEKHLIKYGYNGSIEWNKTLSNGQGSTEIEYKDIIINKNGNIMVATLVGPSWNYGPEEFIEVIGGDDVVSSLIYLQELDSNGNIILNKHMIGGDCYSNENKIKIIEDSQSNYLISAFSSASTISNLIYKVDKYGNQVWGTSISNMDSYRSCKINSAITSDDGGYILVASADEFAEYGIYGNGNLIGIIIKLDKNGNIEWMKENIDTSTFSAIDRLENGNYVLQSEKGIYVYSSEFELLGRYKFENIMYGDSIFKIIEKNKVILPVVYSYSGVDNTSLLVITEEESSIPQRQHIVVYNSLKEFSIMTAADENGTISGMNESIYEKVKYGNNSTKDIIVTPNDGYSVEKIMINGEEVSFTENSDGTVTLPKFENVIQDKMIMATFIEKEKLGYVDVEYYINNTEEKLLPTKEIRGVINSQYTTTPENNVPGYSLVVDKLPQNATGTISNERIKVIYYYEKEPVKITAYYYDIDSNIKISEDKVEYKYANEEYHTYPLLVVPDKYVLDSYTQNREGIVTGNEEGNEINIYYYYRLKEFKIITRCENEGGTITGNGQDFLEKVKYGMNSTKKIVVIPDEYHTVESITINGKEVSFTENSMGNVEIGDLVDVREDKEIVAKFKKANSKVIVSHLDKYTNEKLAEDEILEGYAGEEYYTYAKNNINGYKLSADTVENNYGKFTKQVIHVKYYYEKVVNGVLVKHLESNTNKELADEELILGNVGDKYTTTSKNISGYELISEPTNKDGVITSGVTEVIYYYSKQIQTDIPIGENTPPTGDSIYMIISIVIISSMAFLLTSLKKKRGETNDKECKK